MAKPNYSFEKRQRELSKKKKKEEKAASKAAAKVSGSLEDMNPNEAAAALTRSDDLDGAGAPAPEAPGPDQRPAA